MKKDKKRKVYTNKEETQVLNKKLNDNLSDKDEEKDVWKKISLSFIIFFPYALYLFLFKTKVSKILKVLVVFITSILLFLVFDAAKYPNRVLNELAYKTILEEVDDIGFNPSGVFMADKKDVFVYKQKEYISFNMYDNENMYYIIFEIIEMDKEYDVAYVYKLDNDEKVLYTNNEFSDFEGINPLIFVHILMDDYFVGFDKIEAMSEIKEDDLFYNRKQQDIAILDNILSFEFNEFGVLKYSSDDKSIEKEFEVDYLKETNFNSVYTVLSRNLGENYEVVGYNYYDLAHCFNIVSGDDKYIVEYFYGEGASFEYVENEEYYINYLKNTHRY